MRTRGALAAAAAGALLLVLTGFSVPGAMAMAGEPNSALGDLPPELSVASEPAAAMAPVQRVRLGALFLTVSIVAISTVAGALLRWEYRRRWERFFDRVEALARAHVREAARRQR